MSSFVRLAVCGVVCGAGALGAQDTIHVRRVLPEGELRPGSVLTVSFDRPVAGTLERLRDPREFLRLTPDLPARIEWRDPATIRVVPERPLVPGSVLRVSVGEGREPVVAAWSREFRVRPAAIVGSFPMLNVRGAVPLDVSGTILVRVSGAVDLARLAASARFESAACPALGALRFEVTERAPARDDPWSLQATALRHPRDSVEQRFDRVLSFAPTEQPTPGCAADFVSDLPDDGEQRQVRYPVSTARPFVLTGFSCQSPPDCLAARRVNLVFSAPVALAEVRRLVTVTPAGALVWPDTGDPSPQVSAELRAPAGTIVEVRVAPGMRDVFGRAYAGISSQRLLVGDRPPYATGPAGLVTIARDAPLTIRVRHRNVDSVTVFVRPDPRDPVVALSDIVGAGAGESGWRRQRIALVAPQNVDHETVVALDVPVAWASRLLVVRVGAPVETPGLRLPSADQIPRWREVTARGTVALLQRTALMAHVRAGVAGGGVLVTDVRTGAPRGGVRVSLYNDRAEIVAAGLTGRDGLVRVETSATSAAPLPSREDDGEIPPDDPQWPFRDVRAAQVESATDRVVVPLSTGVRPWRGFAGRGIPWPGGVAWRRAAIHTDRDIFRPGEPMYFTGTIRDGWLHEMRAPTPERIRWRVYRRDEDGKQVVLHLREHGTGAYGVVTDSLRFPVDARLGTWFVRLERAVRGRWTVASEVPVRVAAYRAPEFTVTARADSGALVRGDTVRASVQARLLFDAPLAGGRVTWSAAWRELMRWEIRIPGLPAGWEVGEAPSLWGESREARTLYLNGSTTTDAEGRARVMVPSDTVPFPAGAALQLSMSVEDASRQVVSAEARQVVAGADFHVAARVEGTGWAWRSGEPARLRIGAIDGAGAWRVSERVAVTVVRRYWAPSGQWGFAGWRMHVDTVARDSVVTRDSSSTWSFVPMREAIHELTLVARDARGRETRTTVSRYTVGDGRFAWGDDPLHLQVFASADTTKVGDTLRVSFSSPFERAHAWVTVEREGVLHQERHDVTAGGTTLSLRVASSWIPNAWVGVVLVRQGDLAATDSLPQRYRAGETMVTVDPTPRRLQVTVTPSATEFRPGSVARFRVRLRDASGRAVRGTAVVWAVDEGVLSMTGYATPDPSRVLRAPGTHGITLSTTLASLARALDEPPEIGLRFRGMNSELRLESVVVTSASRLAPAGGADSGAAPAPRSDFRSTAFYRGGIVTDARGEATVRVTLPDNVTTFRLVAVAADAGDRFGVGERPLVVTKPLIVRAAMPRFVRPEDRFDAGGVVNMRGGAATTLVTATARGDGVLALAGATRRDLRVGAEGARADFDWLARRGDVGRVTLGVRAGALTDAVALTLPVRPDQFPRARTIVALVRDTTTLRFTLPAGIDPSTSRLEIRVGPTPLPVIRTWQDFLDTYPYACTEQLASAARGTIALLQLGKAGATRLRDAAALRARLQRTTTLLADRQKADGSFGYWNSTSWTTPWLTAYVALVLADARDLGIEVPGGVMQRAARWLEQLLAATPQYPDTSYGTRAERRRTVQHHLSHRLSAMEALARLGSEVPLDELPPILGDLTFEDRARAAWMLAQVDRHRRLAAQLLTTIWEVVPVSGHRTEFADSLLVSATFPSRIRPAALLLRATQAIAPDHPGIGPLAQMIIQRERAEVGGWWNTQDYAFAAAAVASFMRGDAAQPVPFVLTGDGGRVVLRGIAGEAPIEGRVTLDGLTVAGSRDSVSLPIRVSPSGGPLYVTLTVHEMLRERPVASEARGLVVERWYERFDSGAPVTEVRAGDLVRVRLRVTAPADREFVAIEDPLPAGLEVVDTKLRTSSVLPFMDAAAAEASERGEAEAGGRAMSAYDPWMWWSPRWYPWDETEAHDDRVVFHARFLGSGSHTMSYVARATTTGRFVRPSAHASEMYNPGLNGSSDGGWFVVRPR